VHVSHTPCALAGLDDVLGVVAVQADLTFFQGRDHLDFCDVVLEAGFLGVGSKGEEL
jgi:hypothetical protein